MPANKKLLMLPGDGIGPEVMNQVQRVIDWMDKTRHVSFDVAEDLVGGCAYDAHGTSLTDNTLADAMGVDAVLLGAVGGPKWDNMERDLRPEAGLLKLRKELDLFANLRPATVFPALAEASSLKTELVSGLDLLIIRELTGGVYFGTPRGIEDIGDGQKRAIDTQVYTTGEIDRVCRAAFDLARKRQSRVTSVEKANVMETGVLWREVAMAAHADCLVAYRENPHADARDDVSTDSAADTPRADDQPEASAKPKRKRRRSKRKSSGDGGSED